MQKSTAQALSIHLYREKQLDCLVRLFTASVHQLASPAYTHQQRLAWAPRSPDREAWRQYLSTLQIRVAMMEETEAGFIAFRDSGHIELLYTHPAQARRGVASALYREAEAHLHASSVERLTTDASVVARPFFERMGFGADQAMTVTRCGVALTRFRMSRNL